MKYKFQPLNALLLLACLICSGMVFAESSAQDVASEKDVIADQLIGVWRLEANARTKNGDRRPANQTWEFRTDGHLISVAEDHRADDKIKIKAKYKIEGDVISLQRPGSKRWSKLQVIEIADKTMTLKGGIEGFMFFKRK